MEWLINPTDNDFWSGNFYFYFYFCLKTFNLILESLIENTWFNQSLKLLIVILFFDF